MDPPPSQGPPYSNVRQHLFHSPSQLHLPPVSSSRSDIINTLPSLNPPNRMSAYRHSSPPPSSWSTAHQALDSDDNMPVTMGFVEKLYKVLEDQSSQVVSWDPNGDCFDVNEFTKSVLPRMFGYSNFAAFVKNADDTQFGEHFWTFKHHDFYADHRDAFENIKRKVPAARKSVPSGSGIRPSMLGRSGSAGPPRPLGGELEALQAQTNTLTSHTSTLQNQNSALQSQMNTLQSQTRCMFEMQHCNPSLQGYGTPTP
ncbi:hypothetical protein EDC04DRAFT_2652675 [Pisolithus marmoratus]|nr:hypothetical protein EDC04DRAFT_2652675 [Pisolithus marmoratus]